jgi:hydroxyacylglutathione hydrolase
VKLIERVHLVGSGRLGVSLSSEFDSHVYLVDGGEEMALIDAGAGLATQEILKYANTQGLPSHRIRHLLLTHGHADHAGGTASFRRHLAHLRIYAHPIVAKYLRDGDERGVGLDVGKRAGTYPSGYVLEPASVDTEVIDGAQIRVGNLTLQVLETPGHCDGHHAFLMLCEGLRVLFSGDLIFQGGRILLQNTHDCDLQAYIRSLKRLSGLRVDALLPGHLAFVLRQGQRHIDSALDILDRGGIPPQAL